MSAAKSACGQMRVHLAGGWWCVDTSYGQEAAACVLFSASAYADVGGSANDGQGATGGVGVRRGPPVEGQRGKRTADVGQRGWVCEQGGGVLEDKHLWRVVLQAVECGVEFGQCTADPSWVTRTLQAGVQVAREAPEGEMIWTGGEGARVLDVGRETSAWLQWKSVAVAVVY